MVKKDSDIGEVYFNRFGSMVAFFRYSPIDILSVHLPPSVLRFEGHVENEWIRKEAAEVITERPVNFYPILQSLLNIYLRITCVTNLLF